MKQKYKRQKQTWDPSREYVQKAVQEYLERGGTIKQIVPDSWDPNDNDQKTIDEMAHVNYTFIANSSSPRIDVGYLYLAES